MRDVEAIVDRIRRHYDDGCFACGRENPIGLGLDGFTVESDEVKASFSPRPDYRGTAGTLHGGISATALDEIMVWAGILLNDVVSVTATMEMRFRRGVATSDEVELRGRVLDRSGRRLRLSGQLAVRGETAVEASGMYVVTSELSHFLDGPAEGGDTW